MCHALGHSRVRCGITLRLGVLIVVAVGLLGCQEKVVNYRPFLAGLPGAESNVAIDTSIPGHVDPTQVRVSTIVVENEDGSQTLVTRNARHLIAHIRRTLSRNERDVFMSQVLSQATHEEFLLHGRQPEEAFDMLQRHLKDLNSLFGMMPMGEHTPSVIMSKNGPRVYSVRLTGPATKDLRYVGFNMIMEQGNWRLLWMIEA